MLVSMRTMWKSTFRSTLAVAWEWIAALKTSSPRVTLTNLPTAWASAVAFRAFAVVIPPSTKRVARVAASTATHAAEFRSWRHLVTALVSGRGFFAALLATNALACPSFRAPRILPRSSLSTAVL
jgi:hypothetical protein